MSDIIIYRAWYYICLAAAEFCSRVESFIGGRDGFMNTLILLMVLDCVTGTMCAIMKKKKKAPSYSTFLKGIFKKILIIMLVGVAHTVDLNAVGSHEALRITVICFYLSIEGGSVLRNVSKLGVPIPKKLKSVLSALYDKPISPGDDNTQNNGSHVKR